MKKPKDGQRPTSAVPATAYGTGQQNAQRHDSQHDCCEGRDSMDSLARSRKRWMKSEVAQRIADHHEARLPLGWEGVPIMQPEEER